MEESSPAVSRSGSLPPGVGTPEESRPPPSPLSGAYLLVIISEPQTDAHKAIILQKLAKAFLSWNTEASGIDIERELAIVTALCPEGDFAKHGERLIQNASEHLVTEILIHPQVNTMRQCIRNLLSSFTKYRFIIHSGYTFCGNGSWILQDGTFSTSDFIDTFQEIEVQRVIRAYEKTVKIDICCISEGTWNQSRINQEPFTKICQVEINPSDKISPGNVAVREFVDYLERFITPTSIQELLEPSDIVGNIRFTHPTLYVFPGGEGDVALFGINGFNMLVDGGFSRKACFWNFVRHLDRLDGVLLTRINNSNMGGMSGIVQRKVCSHVYPQIGHFFSNLQTKRNLPSPDGDKDKEPLLVNLIDEGHKMVLNLKKLELKPHRCYRDPNSEPINLYHKVGHGKLDMYVISPAKDSREVKEFLSRWNNYDAKLFSSTSKSGSRELRVPLQNLVSICALLVWQPANPEDHVTRILFPGSAPQHKIFEGFEKMKQLEFLKNSVCTMKSITPVSMTVLKKQKISSEIITDSLHKGDIKNILGENEVDSVHKPINDLKKTKPRKLIEKTVPKEKIEIKTAVPKAVEKTSDNSDITMAKMEEKKKVEIKKIVPKQVPERKLKPPISLGAADKKSESEKSSPTTPKRTVTSAKVISETTKDMTTKPIQESVKSHTIKLAVETKSIADKDHLTKSTLRTPREQIPHKEKIFTKEPASVKEPIITTDQTLIKEQTSKVSTESTKTNIRSTNRTQTPPKIFNAAKSLKDENNRKVAEAKKEIRTRTPPKIIPISKPAAPKKDEDISALKIEKKPIPIKRPRLPAKLPSTQSSAPVGVKKVVPIRPLKADEAKKNLKKDIEKTDSSAVSTPSTLDADAVPSLTQGTGLLEITKVGNESAKTLAPTDDKLEQNTNITTYVSNIYRQEGHGVDDEDEILVIETTEMKQISSEEQKYLRDEKESEKKKDQEKELDKDEKLKDMKKPLKIDTDKDLLAQKSPTEKNTLNTALEKNLLTPEEKDKISGEVEGIITTATRLVNLKDSDLKSIDDDQRKLEIEKEEKMAFESASTTTAPTMPEDEKVDDIKQEIEEKYDKEETKEKSMETKSEPELVNKDEKVEEIRKSVSKKDVKTPDEVADLPVDDETEASLQQEEKDQVSNLLDQPTIMQPVTDIVELKHAEYVTITPTPVSSPDEKPSPLLQSPDNLKEKSSPISPKSGHLPLEDTSEILKSEKELKISETLESKITEPSVPVELDSPTDKTQEIKLSIPTKKISSSSRATLQAESDHTSVSATNISLGLSERVDEQEDSINRLADEMYPVEDKIKSQNEEQILSKTSPTVDLVTESSLPSPTTRNKEEKIESRKLSVVDSIKSDTQLPTSESERKLSSTDISTIITSDEEKLVTPGITQEVLNKISDSKIEFKDLSTENLDASKDAKTTLPSLIDRMSLSDQQNLLKKTSPDKVDLKNEFVQGNNSKKEICPMKITDEENTEIYDTYNISASSDGNIDASESLLVEKDSIREDFTEISSINQQKTEVLSLDDKNTAATKSEKVSPKLEDMTAQNKSPDTSYDEIKTGTVEKSENELSLDIISAIDEVKDSTITELSETIDNTQSNQNILRTDSLKSPPTSEQISSSETIVLTPQQSKYTVDGEKDSRKSSITQFSPSGSEEFSIKSSDTGLEIEEKISKVQDTDFENLSSIERKQSLSKSTTEPILKDKTIASIQTKIQPCEEKTPADLELKFLSKHEIPQADEMSSDLYKMEQVTEALSCGNENMKQQALQNKEETDQLKKNNLSKEIIETEIQAPQLEKEKIRLETDIQKQEIVLEESISKQVTSSELESQPEILPLELIPTSLHIQGTISNDKEISSKLPDKESSSRSVEQSSPTKIKDEITLETQRKTSLSINDASKTVTEIISNSNEKSLEKEDKTIDNKSILEVSPAMIEQKQSSKKYSDDETTKKKPDDEQVTIDTTDSVSDISPISDTKILDTAPDNTGIISKADSELTLTESIQDMEAEKSKNSLENIEIQDILKSKASNNISSQPISQLLIEETQDNNKITEQYSDTENKVLDSSPKDTKVLPISSVSTADIQEQFLYEVSTEEKSLSKEISSTQEEEVKVSETDTKLSFEKSETYAPNEDKKPSLAGTIISSPDSLSDSMEAISEQHKLIKDELRTIKHTEGIDTNQKIPTVKYDTGKSAGIEKPSIESENAKTETTDYKHTHEKENENIVEKVTPQTVEPLLKEGVAKTEGGEKLPLLYPQDQKLDYQTEKPQTVSQLTDSKRKVSSTESYDDKSHFPESSVSEKYNEDFVKEIKDELEVHKLPEVKEKSKIEISSKSISPGASVSDDSTEELTKIENVPIASSKFISPDQIDKDKSPVELEGIVEMKEITPFGSTSTNKLLQDQSTTDDDSMKIIHELKINDIVLEKIEAVHPDNSQMLKEIALEKEQLSEKNADISRKSENNEITDLETAEEFLQEKTEIHDELTENIKLRIGSISDKIEIPSSNDSKILKDNSSILKSPEKEYLSEEISSTSKLEKSETIDQQTIEEFIQEQTELHDDLVEKITKSQRNGISDKIETTSPSPIEIKELKETPSEIKSPEKKDSDNAIPDTENLEESKRVELQTANEFIQAQSAIDNDLIEKIVKSQRGSISDKTEILSPVDSKTLEDTSSTVSSPAKEYLHEEISSIRKKEERGTTDQPTIEEFIQEQNELHDNLVERITKSQRNSISERIETTRPSPIESTELEEALSEIKSHEKEYSNNAIPDTENMEESQIVDLQTAKEFIQAQSEIDNDLIEKIVKSQRDSISDETEILSPVDFKILKDTSSIVKSPAKEYLHEEISSTSRLEKGEITDQQTNEEFIQEQTELHDNLVERITKSQRSSISENIETNSSSPMKSKELKEPLPEMKSREKEYLDNEILDTKKLEESKRIDLQTVKEFIQEQTEVDNNLIEKIVKSQRGSISEKPEIISPIDSEVLKKETCNIKKIEESETMDQQSVQEFIEEQTQLHDELIEKITKSQRNSISDKIETTSPSPIEFKELKETLSEIKSCKNKDSDNAIPNTKNLEESKRVDLQTANEFIQAQSAIDNDLIEKIVKSQGGSISDTTGTIGSPTDSKLVKDTLSKIKLPEKGYSDKETSRVKPLEESEPTNQHTITEFIQEQTQIHDNLVEKITKSQRSNISDGIETESLVQSKVLKDVISKTASPEKDHLEKSQNNKKLSDEDRPLDLQTSKEFIQEQTATSDKLVENITTSPKSSMVTDEIENVSPIKSQTFEQTPCEIQFRELEQCSLKKSKGQITVLEIEEQIKLPDESIESITKSQCSSTDTNKFETIHCSDSKLIKETQAEITSPKKESSDTVINDAEKMEKNKTSNLQTVKEFIQEQTEINDELIEKVIKSQRSNVVIDKIETVSPTDEQTLKENQSEDELIEKEDKNYIGNTIKSKDIDTTNLRTAQDILHMQGEIHEELIEKITKSQRGSITSEEVDPSATDKTKSPTSPKIPEKYQTNIKPANQDIVGEPGGDNLQSEKLEANIITSVELKSGGTSISDNKKITSCELQSSKESFIKPSASSDEVEKKSKKSIEGDIKLDKPFCHSFDSQILKDFPTDHYHLRKKSFPDDKTYFPDNKAAQLTGLHRHTLTSIRPEGYGIDKSAEEITSELILENAVAIESLNKESFDEVQVDRYSAKGVVPDDENMISYSTLCNKQISLETPPTDLNTLKEKSTELEKLTKQLENQKKTSAEEISAISKQEIKSNELKLYSDEQLADNKDVMANHYSPTQKEDTRTAIGEISIHKDDTQSLTHTELESTEDEFATADAFEIGTITKSIDNQIVSDKDKIQVSRSQEDTVSPDENKSKESLNSIEKFSSEEITSINETDLKHLLLQTATFDSTSTEKLKTITTVEKTQPKESEDIITSKEFLKEEAGVYKHTIEPQEMTNEKTKIYLQKKKDNKTDDEREENIIEMVRDFIHKERVIDSLLTDEKCEVESDQALASHLRDQMDKTATLARKDSDEQDKPLLTKDDIKPSDITFTSYELTEQSSQKETSPEKQSDIAGSETFITKTLKIDHDSVTQEKFENISKDPSKLTQSVYSSAPDDSKGFMKHIKEITNRNDYMHDTQITSTSKTEATETSLTSSEKNEDGSQSTTTLIEKVCSSLKESEEKTDKIYSESSTTSKVTYSIDDDSIPEELLKELAKIESNKVESTYTTYQTGMNESVSTEKMSQEKTTKQFQEVTESPVRKFATHAEETVTNIASDAIKKLDETADINELIREISDQTTSDNFETSTEYFIEKYCKEPSGRQTSDDESTKDQICSTTYVTTTSSAVITDDKSYSTVVVMSGGEAKGDKDTSSSIETITTITTSSPTVRTSTMFERRGSQPCGSIEADKSNLPISPELQLDATQMRVKFTTDRKEDDDSKRFTLKCKSNSEEFFDSSSNTQDMVGDLSSKFEKREPVAKTVSLPILDEKFEDAKTNVDVEKIEDFSRSYPYLEKISNNEGKTPTNLSDPTLIKQVEGELQSKSVSMPVIKRPDDSERYMTLPHLYKTDNLEDLTSNVEMKTTVASTTQEQKESEDGGTTVETAREESVIIGPIKETEEPAEDTYTFVKTIRTFIIDDESGDGETTTITTIHSSDEMTEEKNTVTGHDRKASSPKEDSTSHSDISPEKSAQSQTVDDKQRKESTKSPDTTDISQMSASMMQSFYGSYPDDDGDQEKSENKSEIKAKESETESSHSAKKDPIGDWGKPLGLPDERSMSTLLVWNPLEDWGKPLGLPSPTPTPISNGQHRESNGDIEITLAPVNTKSTPKRTVKKPSEKNHTARDTSKNRDSSTKKTKSSKQVNPLYVDLAYVPHHGNPYYTTVEFFKRIRARYYVFSGTDPNKDVFNALLEGKKSWENQDLEVTIISTYDTDVLGYWITENEETLANLRIDLAPSASRCTINLQDHDTSCSAYRLEF